MLQYILKGVIGKHHVMAIEAVHKTPEARHRAAQGEETSEYAYDIRQL